MTDRRDNAPPPEGWTPEPRCCPFNSCAVCEAAQEGAEQQEAHLIRGDN